MQREIYSVPRSEERHDELPTTTSTTRRMPRSLPWASRFVRSSSLTPSRNTFLPAEDYPPHAGREAERRFDRHPRRGARTREMNTRLRSDESLQRAFGRTGCAEQSVVQQTLNACTARNVPRCDRPLISSSPPQPHLSPQPPTTSATAEHRMTGMHAGKEPSCQRRATSSTKGIVTEGNWAEPRGRTIRRSSPTVFMPVVTTLESSPAVGCCANIDPQREMTSVKSNHLRIDAGGGPPTKQTGFWPRLSTSWEGHLGPTCRSLGVDGEEVVRRSTASRSSGRMGGTGDDSRSRSTGQAACSSLAKAERADQLWDAHLDARPARCARAARSACD